MGTKACLLVVMAGLALAGCADIKSMIPRKAKPASATAVVMPPPDAVTVEEFDTTTAEQRAEAVLVLPASGAVNELGTTVASLGSPTEPGFWMKTPLVTAPRKGRVETVTGNAVAVDLIPSGGAAGSGSQLSLAAFRALGLSLTGLPQVRVFGL